MIVNGLVLCLLVVSPIIGCEHGLKQSEKLSAPAHKVELEPKNQIKATADISKVEQVTQQMREQKDDSNIQRRVKRAFLHLKPRSEHDIPRAPAEPKFQVLKASKLGQRQEDPQVQREEQKHEEIPVLKEEQKREELPLQKEEQKREETPLQKVGGKEEQKRDDLPLQKEEQKREDLPLQKEEQKHEELTQQKEEIPLQKEEQKRDDILLIEEGKKREELSSQKEETKIEQVQAGKKVVQEQKYEQPLPVKSSSQIDKHEQVRLDIDDNHHRQNCDTSPLPFDCDKRPDPLLLVSKPKEKDQADSLISGKAIETSRTVTLLTNYEVPHPTLVVTRTLQQNPEQISSSFDGKTREEPPLKVPAQPLRPESQPIKGRPIIQAQPILVPIVQAPLLQEEIKGGKKLEEQSQFRAPLKGQRDDHFEAQLNQDNIKSSELRAPRMGELRLPQRVPLGFESASAHNRFYRQRPTYVVPARYPTVPAVLIRSYPTPLMRGHSVSRAHLQRARYPPSPVQGYRRNYRTGLDQPVYGNPRVSFYSPITRPADDNLSGF